MPPPVAIAEPASSPILIEEDVPPLKFLPETERSEPWYGEAASTTQSSSSSLGTDAATSVWFNSAVLTLEPSLRGWLRSRYPHVVDHDDLIQEAYIKLLRAHRRRPIRNARSLLFTIARNLAVDRIRRDICSPLQDVSRERAYSVPGNDPDGLASTTRSDELQLLGEALARVPPRARAALQLCLFEGLTGPEAGARLGISHHTVTNHVAAAIRCCAQYFQANGYMDGPATAPTQKSA